MRLIDLTCPNCNGAMKIQEGSQVCTCEFCGTKFLVDDQTVHHTYDDAEAAGYQFEKGRQRAIAEQYNAMNYAPPARKRRTWLWVLGWIFIFPVPLTILLLRSNLDNKIKYAIIAAVWILYLIMGTVGSVMDTSNPADSSATGTNGTEAGAANYCDQA